MIKAILKRALVMGWGGLGFVVPLKFAGVEGHGVGDLADFKLFDDRAIALEEGHGFASLAAHDRPFEESVFGQAVEREAIDRAEKGAGLIDADLDIEILGGVLKERIGDEADANFLFWFEGAWAVDEG